METGNTSWKSLFATSTSASAIQLEVVVFKKSGLPLLIVPTGDPALARALDLYPAQTARARLARAVWRQAIRCRLALGGERQTVLVDTNDPFLEFLRDSVPSTRRASHQQPRFAILAGNPHAPGRRFLILLFSEAGQPLVVVKTGNQSAAVELIEKEISFLSGVPGGLPGVPKLRAQFCNGPIRALALDFVPGDSPAPAQAPELEAMLQAWLKPGRRVIAGELPAWQRLRAAAAREPLFGKLEGELCGLSVQAALFHGDLAPWNIKVPQQGTWMVIDWERGELAGPPAWDWFHFILQPAMLVQRQDASKLVETAQATLDSAAFGEYARNSGLVGHERAWLLAYLLYCRDVLRPAEGSPRVVELLSFLAQRWTSH